MGRKTLFLPRRSDCLFLRYIWVCVCMFVSELCNWQAPAPCYVSAVLGQSCFDPHSSDATCVLAHWWTGVLQLSPEDLNTDRRLRLHAHTVDKQSEHHKGTIATILLPTRQTRPFKMSNEKAIARVQCSFDSEWAHHLTIGQFMDSPYLGYKAEELDLRLFKKLLEIYNTILDMCGKQ